MFYAMVLLNRVIDVIEAETMPYYPPNPNGDVITAVPTDATTKIGMGYDPETGEFAEYIPEPEPTPTLSESEQAILDTAVNTEYLVCLADMGI